MPSRTPPGRSHRSEMPAITYPDGSERETFEDPPRHLLAEGPVWLMDELRAVSFARADSAAVTNDGAVVLSNGASVSKDEVTRYELVRIVDPDGRDSQGRTLWEGLERGQQLVLVWALLAPPD